LKIDLESIRLYVKNCLEELFKYIYDKYLNLGVETREAISKIDGIEAKNKSDLRKIIEIVDELRERYEQEYNNRLVYATGYLEALIGVIVGVYNSVKGD